jgi:hypothetical protein
VLSYLRSKYYEQKLYVAMKVPKPVRERMSRFLNIGDIVKTLQKDGVDVKELL